MEGGVRAIMFILPERCDLTDMMPDHPAGHRQSSMRQVSNAVNGHGLKWVNAG